MLDGTLNVSVPLAVASGGRRLTAFPSGSASVSVPGESEALSDDLDAALEPVRNACHEQRALGGLARPRALAAAPGGEQGPEPEVRADVDEQLVRRKQRQNDPAQLDAEEIEEDHPMQRLSQVELEGNPAIVAIALQGRPWAGAQDHVRQRPDALTGIRRGACARALARAGRSGRS